MNDDLGSLLQADPHAQKVRIVERLAYINSQCGSSIISDQAEEKSSLLLKMLEILSLEEITNLETSLLTKVINKVILKLRACTTLDQS